MTKGFPMVFGVLVLGIISGIALPISNNANVEVYFSPDGGCTKKVVDLIDKANSNIYVQSYTFTSKSIYEALLRANTRNVKVFVILDKKMRNNPAGIGKGLEANNIPVWYDGVHAIAHNKLIIIDDNLVIGGSFNHTVSAEIHNAENMTVTTSKGIAKLYMDNWTVHLNHSVK